MAAPPSPRAARWTFIILAVVIVTTLVLHVGYGSTDMLSPVEVVQQLLKGPVEGDRANAAVWQYRLVRALGCVCIGGILGGVGSAFQALFRNPLADPFVVGASSGAAFGSVIAMLAGLAAGGLIQAGFAFAGGLLSLGLVVAIAGRRGATNVVTLLLAGAVIGSMVSAVLSLVILLAGRDTNELMRWLLGDTDVHYWTSVALLGGALIFGTCILVTQARALNAFSLGEETARRLGVDTRRLKAIILVTGAAMTAVAVGTAGIIGFIGLVAPHIARGILGTDWRRSLVGSVLVGAGLLLVADAIAQLAGPSSRIPFLHAVSYLPVGVVTAIIGAPSLLILLRRASA